MTKQETIALLKQQMPSFYSLEQVINIVENIKENDFQFDIDEISTNIAESINNENTRKMKRFYVTERIPCVQIWTYEVEAETEEDAIKQVIDGTAEVVDSSVEEHNYEESEYEVEEDEDFIDDIVELKRGEDNK